VDGGKNKNAQGFNDEVSPRFIPLTLWMAKSTVLDHEKLPCEAYACFALHKCIVFIRAIESASRKRRKRMNYFSLEITQRLQSEDSLR